MYDPNAAYFEHKTVMIPADEKRHRGGEDAADASDTILAVGDGVGSWALKGIDPGIFSSKMTETIVSDYLENPENDAKSHIRKGCAEAAVGSEGGSATVVAAKLHNDRYLEVSTLGDCGMIIFRPLKGDRLGYVYETKPFQHMFNAPAQCGT
jgi:hypothetical protein